MLTFEWDDGKDRRNEDKHGLSFEVAISVFDDPGGLVEYNGIFDTEDRWQVTGLTRDVLIVVVIYSIRAEHSEYETYRIISARKASKSERRRYEEAAQY